MSIHALFAALAAGQPHIIPAEYRVTIIRLVISSRKKTVKYDGKQTRCPVCEAMGLGLSEIRVNRTDKEVRYCECKRCSATFPAIGEPEIVPEEPVFEPVKLPKKGKNKRKR